MVPADDQAIVLPCASAIVIMVLLNEAATCATPDAMFFRSRRRPRVPPFPILNPSAPARRYGAGLILFIKSVPGSSFSRQWSWPGLYECAHSCGCAGREPEAPCGGAGRGSSRDPSAA